MRELRVYAGNGDLILTSGGAAGTFLGTVAARPDLGGFKAYDDDDTGLGTFATLEAAALRVVAVALESRTLSTATLDA